MSNERPTLLRVLFRAKRLGPAPTHPSDRHAELGSRGVTIRYAFPDDELALLRLAAVDEQPRPTGTVLVAQVGDALWAAVSVDGDGAVADPFHPTSELLFLLLQRARQLRGQDPRRGRLRHALRGWRMQLD